MKKISASTLLCRMLIGLGVVISMFGCVLAEHHKYSILTQYRVYYPLILIFGGYIWSAIFTFAETKTTNLRGH